MNQREPAFDLLARLFRYPRQDYRETVELCRQALLPDSSEAARLLARFAEEIAPLSLETLEEVFTQTFDLNPVCCLELGWHLFGENYDRGELLVKVRHELRRHGVAESTELPDHLTHVLPLLGRMPPAEADSFARALVWPALKKMQAGLEGKNNPFQRILQAVPALLDATVFPSTERIEIQAAICDPEEVAHE